MVFTGLSGSGKSSLAFDTIYAEGQRRYVESLSAYARQFLGQMDKPDVDFIEGLSPAISIDQKSASRNPRSTVGTVTEVYDYLRLLFARIGRPHCPSCGREVGRQTPQQIVDQVLELGDAHAAARARSRRAGAQGRVPRAPRRPRPPGLLAGARRRRRPRAHRPRDARPRALRAAHDRGRRRPARRARRDPPAAHRVRRDRAAARQRLGGGRRPRRGRRPPTSELVFSEQLACAECGISFDEPAPRDFSFNSPVRGVPDVRGPRHPLRGRRPARRARPLALGRRRRARTVGGRAHRLLRRASSAAPPSSASSRSTRRGAS